MRVQELLRYANYDNLVALFPNFVARLYEVKKENTLIIEVPGQDAPL